MKEKLPGSEIFTPEQLKKMAEGAAANEKAEAVRSGDHVPYSGPSQEEFEKPYKGIKEDKAAWLKTKRITEPSRPVNRPAKRLDWLSRWEDKQEEQTGGLMKMKKGIKK